MFEYENIAFRPIDRTDLEELRALHNEESTFMNLATIDLVDEIGQIKWWENLHKNTSDKRYVIVFKNEPNEILGRLRIQNIDRQNCNCEVGLDIKAKYRGKGYGKKSYHMLLNYLFLHYNMNLVYLKVADFNPDARKLYEKVGFQETGRFPNYFYRHGKYWDYILMSLLKSSYSN